MLRDTWAMGYVEMLSWTPLQPKPTSLSGHIMLGYQAAEPLK